MSVHNNKRITITAILTCHNRMVKTVACLDALYASVLPHNYSLKVILVDDGSSDGTTEIVLKKHPNTHIVTGDGNLYWNGGMRLAFAAAMNDEPDYYLWVNDDTLLYKNTLKKLIACELSECSLTKKDGIVVGSVIDPMSKTLSYGGNNQQKFMKRLKFLRVEPDTSKVIEADTMNGNCVLLSREVVNSLGNLDSNFTHGMGDYDYGLRAKKIGIRVWIAPFIAGTCKNDFTIVTSHLNDLLSLKKRWRLITSPKGLPLKEWFVFCSRHGGFFWPLIYCGPYIKIFYTHFIRRLIK